MYVCCEPTYVCMCVREYTTHASFCLPEVSQTGSKHSNFCNDEFSMSRSIDILDIKYRVIPKSKLLWTLSMFKTFHLRAFNGFILRPFENLHTSLSFFISVSTYYYFFHCLRKEKKKVLFASNSNNSYREKERNHNNNFAARWKERNKKAQINETSVSTVDLRDIKYPFIVYNLRILLKSSKPDI